MDARDSSACPLPRLNRHLLAVALIAGAGIAAATPALAAPAASAARSAPRGDAAAAIDAAAAGDLGAIEAALAAARDPASRALLRAQHAALLLDDAGGRRALADPALRTDRDPRRRAIAQSIRADLAFARGDYADAAAAIRAWQALPAAAHHGDEAGTMAQTLAIAAALADVPAQQRRDGAGTRIATHRDAAGLVRGSVAVNGVASDAVLDTGANLSVVSASEAVRLNIRLLDGKVSVGTPTAARVPTRLGVADRLTIAGVTLANVVFLVMDDDQLRFPLPGGYRIDAIIGFPVLRALGRIRFDRDGGFAAGNAAAEPADDIEARRAARLTGAGSDLYVEARFGTASAVLHLDTGATHTSLSSRFAAAHRPLLAGLDATTQRSSAAGGTVRVRDALEWKSVPLGIAGRALTLDRIAVAAPAPGASLDDKMGVLGQDVLRAFDHFTLDFDTMRFALGRPVAR